MPELPEVETVRRGLAPRLVGRAITAAEIRDGRLTAPVDPLEVSLELGGERFTGVGRRGKYLLFELATGRTLVVHLRMTGWFHHRPPESPDPLPEHIRAVFDLDDGSTLVYRDQRRFGTMRLIEPGGLDEYLRLRAGPEPLSPDWTPKRLRADLAGRRAPIKALLLHQGIVAGVGNIYADEALWQARIHPLRPGGGLTAAEVKRLHAAVVEALERGIDSRGASIRDYRDVDGERGGMQERFAAYGRTGEPCFRCGTPIQKIRVAQRGTHLCPRCTRPPAA
ncbi:MAG TPA: bifunctional DNA-formamidopyrimidine glycosylase/DNA-(apurinic or apyrimidinic site) lyase [Gaiellales bacterium]|jgi:formamidopyrimidine-DNA glycosylase